MESESNQRFDRGSKSAESSSSKHSGPGCGSAPPSSSASTFVPPPSDALGKLGVIENTADVNQKKIASSLQENSTDIELAEYGGAEDDDSMDSQFTEGVDVPRRHLGYVQTTSLMLNATIGSGIFTTPGYVLALTRSKEICLILWAVGGIYSALAITIFLEYGTALPFNGMALIYLDEVFPRPKLMATVVFSVFWILFAGTVTSSKTVAQSILSIAGSQTSTSDISKGQLKFTAIVVQTVVCLLLYFVRRLCFVFNTAFALYKLILLLFIFITGMIASQRVQSGFFDFDTKFSGYSGTGSLTAVIYILFCYQGWENANYIAGEIKDCKRTLKWAAVTTIVILTSLYIMVTLAFFAVTDYVTLTNADGQSNAATQFAQKYKVFGSSTGMQVAIAIAVFSDQLISTYTTAKVKQAIAWQRIIPFYRFFGHQNQRLDSPGGALFLHWVFTVIPLLAVNLTNDERPFFTGIYTYGYQLMFMSLGIGLPRLQSRMQVANSDWRPTYLKNRGVLIVVCFIFAGVNIVILVIDALPSEKGTTPRFYWPIASAGVFAVGIIYWGMFRMLEVRKLKNEKSLGSTLGLEIHIYEEGDRDISEATRPLLRDAVRDGTRRRVQYKVTGPASRVRDVYRKTYELTFKSLGY